MADTGSGRTDGGETRPYRLFISYSHRSEAIKDRLLIHLAPLKLQGLVSTWNDREIPPGAYWRKEIEQAMNAADAAVFILCADFLASSFCQDVEICDFLHRYREHEQVLILFVLADTCSWKKMDYISPFQVIPRDDRPIKKFRNRADGYTLVAEEIASALASRPARAVLTLPEPLQPESATTNFDRMLAKLPGQTLKLLGRDEELARLDTWHAHRGVLLWVADGGYGKSALVREWLERREFTPSTRFIGQSFYSQGSHNQATTARPFLLESLKAWNIAHPPDAPDEELGRLLADAAAKSPSLIVLDGLEPLQQSATGDPNLHGLLRDRGLEALIRGLSEQPGEAACLATSRLALPDAALPAGRFQQRKLSELAPAAAQDLLAQRGTVGGAGELAQMAERCGFHPLTLVLAAEFCHSFLDDSTAAFLARDWPGAARGVHSATVMGWFDAALAEERQQLDRDLARVLGLFDRPAPWAALLALRAEAPPIAGLTEALHRATDDELLKGLARLRQWGLLDTDLARPEPDLDTHPLVREHFGARLKRENPAAYRAAQRRLFDWFRNLPDKHQPDTLEEMEPLYRAMWHGCKAEAYRTALLEVYRARIERGEKGFSALKLGAYSRNLSALLNFFPGGWDDLPVKGKGDERLDEADRLEMLAEVSFCLMSLGHTQLALRPRLNEWQRRITAKDWKNYSRSSENIINLYTALGRWADAEKVSLELLSKTEYLRSNERQKYATIAHARLGRIYYGQGKLQKASEHFSNAETIQIKSNPRSRYLPGLAGFDYSQLLMATASKTEDFERVLERCQTLLARLNEDETAPPFLRAIHHLSIGLAHLSLDKFSKASESFDLAVSGMKMASLSLLLPFVFLARARLYRSQSNFELAWTDRNEAFGIANVGDMSTWLADAALLAGQLHLDQRNISGAAVEFTEAARRVHRDGQGRRLAELRLLDARLRHYQHDPSAANAALAAAEARIREIGQWGYWRDLRAVAKEIGAADPGECPAPPD